MNPSLEYFDRISSLGPPALALGVIVTINIAFTSIHIWQEWRTRWPLYRVFGAIVGLAVPRSIGVLVFVILLAVTLWGAGLAAYTGLPRTACICFSIGALGFVLGARLADSILSHWILALIGYRPNPGLSSTALYILEAILIFVAFRPGLALDRGAAAIGFAAGWLFFILPLPTMALLSRIFPRARRKPWVRGEPIPDWADAANP